jgi:hypothetical protein
MQPPDVLWKYVVNPVMRTLLRAPTHRLVDEHLMLLAYQGRKSGKRYVVPVGYHWIDGRMSVLTNAGWRVNFRGGHPVVVRFKGRLLSGTATLREDPDDIARIYADLIDDVGWQQAGRRLGIRINVDRPPTDDELVAAVRTYGLSLVEVDVGVSAPTG